MAFTLCGRHRWDDRGRRAGSEGDGRGTSAFALTDPHGAALFNYYAHGELEGRRLIGRRRHRAGTHHRQSRRLAPDRHPYRISDEEGLVWVARLLQEEGLCLGLSFGHQLSQARVALGKQLVAEGRARPRVVTILCWIPALRYLSTLLLILKWLSAKGLPVFGWLQQQPEKAGAA